MKPSSPERFSDEEILMTLKMPSDPSGTPGGFFDFLDPCQEVSPSGEAEILSEKSPSLDFASDFETGLGFSSEVPEGEVVEKVYMKMPAPPAVVFKPKSPMLLGPSVLRRSPSMPTILEEDEVEVEDGDVTITPSAAQRALLPPDRFARPPSVAQTTGATDVPEDIDGDSLDTPRPRGEFVSFLSAIDSAADR